MPAGRLRRTRAGASARPDRGPVRADRRGGHALGLAVRAVPALRLRGGVRLRGRRPAGREAGRGAEHRPHAARAAARAGRAPGVAGRGGPGRGRASAAASGARACGPGRRGGGGSFAAARPAHRRRDRGAVDRSGRGSRLDRLPGRRRSRGARRARRPHDVGRGRGRGPAPRRSRRAAAARGAVGVPRRGRGPAGRAPAPSFAHARSVHRRGRGRPLRVGCGGGPRCARQACSLRDGARRGVPSRCLRPGVVRRRGAPPDPPPLPGHVAQPDRARLPLRAGPVPAGLAGSGREWHRGGRGRCRVRRGRRARGDRAARRCGRPGLRGGAVDPGPAGARLFPGDARRAPGRWRGDLVRPGEGRRA